MEKNYTSEKITSDLKVFCKSAKKQKAGLSQITKANILLLIAAIIWGFGFAAQRAGMNYIGPFTFNGIRFALGCMVLLPFIINSHFSTRSELSFEKINFREYLQAGVLSGGVLFIGASFQQSGIVFTSAGNAGFITGLYVIFVPIFGLFQGRKTNFGTWLGTILAATGLYFLSITESFTISKGDLLVLIGAIAWAVHVQIIAAFSPKMEPLLFAFAQFAVCSVLCLGVSMFFETWQFHKIIEAARPLFFGGCISVGIAYTLQIIGQRHAPPSHAAIILSLETVFAAIGGYLILQEVFTSREFLGCLLMLAGMLFSQLYTTWFKN